MDEDIEWQVRVCSERYDIPEYVIYAIIHTESRFKRNVYYDSTDSIKNRRWVKSVVVDHGLDPDNPTNYYSVGYMQVLPVSCYYLGYEGSYSKLWVARWNIDNGCKNLRYWLDKYRNLDDALSAYNQGSRRFVDANTNGRKDRGESYRNQRYVDAVKRRYKGL